MRSAPLTALVLVALMGSSGVAEAARLWPLPLHPRELRSSPEIAQAFDGRYVVGGRRDGRVNVVDDVSGRRYSQALQAGCFVFDLRVPEALLSCPEVPQLSSGPDQRRPLILNLIDGHQSTLVRGPEYEYPRTTGYSRVDFSYFRLGSQWIQGSYDTFEPHNPIGTVYLNRFSGERRENLPYRGLDLDSPHLSPDERPQACKGPGRRYLDPSTRRWLTSKRRKGRDELVLRRCGRNARLISRCPDQCYGRQLTRRFAVWAGNESVVIHSIRTGRRFKLRFPGYRDDSAATGYGIVVAATDRRVRVTLARRGPIGPRKFRIIEVRLPRSLR